MSELVYVPEIIDHPSANQSPRKAGVRVDTVLIHHTATKDDAPALRWLLANASGVSAHYVVGVAGSVWRLVPERRAAWHAGVAHLPWETGPWVVNGKKTSAGYGWFNSRSIGIEVVNPGDGKTPFTEAQYRALCWLVPDIVYRHMIRWEPAPERVVTHSGMSYVLGHRDVAPGRKTDPADNFDWARIREALAGGSA